jgi:hypothetical protein
VLARCPWPPTSDAFTAAYLVGAIFTDSGLAADLVRAVGGFVWTGRPGWPGFEQVMLLRAGGQSVSHFHPAVSS